MLPKPHSIQDIENNFMAYYAHRELHDQESVKFLESIGAIKMDSCVEDYSLWHYEYYDLLIPRMSFVRNWRDLILLVDDASYTRGYRDGITSAKRNLTLFLDNALEGK